jgi:hypothetical protein
MCASLYSCRCVTVVACACACACAAVAACTKEQLSLLARLVAEVEHLAVGEAVTAAELAWVSKLLSTMQSIHATIETRFTPNEFSPTPLARCLSLCASGCLSVEMLHTGATTR